MVYVWFDQDTGEISLSSKLNTNVPFHAKMGVSVFDGKNEVGHQKRRESSGKKVKM